MKKKDCKFHKKFTKHPKNVTVFFLVQELYEFKGKNNTLQKNSKFFWK